MQLGINGTGLVQNESTQAVIDDAERAAADDFAHCRLAKHATRGYDAITTLALVGASVLDIGGGGDFAYHTASSHGAGRKGSNGGEYYAWPLYTGYWPLSLTHDGSVRHRFC